MLYFRFETLGAAMQDQGMGIEGHRKRIKELRMQSEFSNNPHVRFLPAFLCNLICSFNQVPTFIKVHKVWYVELSDTYSKKKQ